MYTKPVTPEKMGKAGKAGKAGAGAGAGKAGKAGKITMAAVLAAGLSLFFYGCEDPNAGSSPSSNKAVDRLEVIDHPYRVSFEPNVPSSREREKLLSYVGNDTAKLPKYKGYREGEFLSDEHLTDTGQNRLILHGLSVRVHYVDGSSQKVSFPEDWTNNVMQGLGTDGHGMRFSWSSGMNWMVARLDDKSASFEIPFYRLEQVMIDVGATDAAGTRKFYSMLDTDMEKAKLVIKGHYSQIGWYPIPEGVDIDTTYQPGLRGYLGPQDIKVRVYTGMNVEGSMRDSILSASSQTITPPTNGTYSPSYQVYVLPVFSLDPAAPEAEYTTLAPFDTTSFAYTGSSSIIFSSSGTTINAFSIGQYEIPYALWYAVAQWASWYKGYIFTNDSRTGAMTESEQETHKNLVGTEQSLNNLAKFKTGNQGTSAAPPSQGSPPSGEYYQPVTYITWKDAALWCNAYTELMNAAAAGNAAGWTKDWVIFGMTASALPAILNGAGNLNPAYLDSSNATITTIADFDGIPAAATTASTKTGYRLPDETEWEFAARGGASGGANSFYGAGGDVLGDVAWYNTNSGNQTHPIGGKTGFAVTYLTDTYRLFDMIGNVAEWINVIATPISTNTNSVNDYDNTVVSRILRGGAFNNYDYNCRLNADRKSLGPQQSGSTDVGFRIARKL